MSQSYFQGLNNSMSEAGTFDRIGQIKAIRYADDELNVSKKYVEYDVLVNLDRGTKTTLKNVRSISTFSGTNDYSYRVYESNEFAASGELGDTNPSQNQNGTYVVIGFIDGNFFQPFIKGSLDHPGLEPEALKEKGIHAFSTFRGFEEAISSKGEMSLSYTGEKDVQGKLLDAEEVPVTFKIGKTAELGEEHDPAKAHSMVLFKDGLSLNFKDGTVLIINSEESSISVAQKDGNKVTVNAEGILVEESNGAEIKVSQGAVSVKDSSGGSLKIADGKVGIGSSSAELVDLLYQLANELSTDTFAGFGAPAGKAALYAQLAIKANSIKGGI